MAGKPRMPAEFRIDWNYGYSLYDTQSNECIWKYRYSQLKGSSDDGISSLKLLFRDEKTGGIETRVSVGYQIKDLNTRVIYSHYLQ